MTRGNVQTYTVQIPKELVQYWGWFLAFGILLVALGIAAVGRPSRLQSSRCCSSDLCY